ncbi:MAG: discoidin domain-containing protein, partial [Candidatus Hydrogenedentes bacterium]|nr:discoidin domain-containing protein [Candidatus Hydrogenedentota bacterium]
MSMSIVLSFALGLMSAVYTPDVAVSASSDSGGKYAPGRAVDGDSNTRWASAKDPALPQWFEVRLDEPSMVDAVFLEIAVDNLYSDWKEIELTFSEGERVQRSLKPESRMAAVGFEPRRTEWVRVSVLSVHHERAYVGLYEVHVAYQASEDLQGALAGTVPLPEDAIEARGRTGHPCVNVTADDVAQARVRAERYDWARAERDTIIEEAESWLRETDEYWMQFVPEPGACYAYGRTGCPICGGTFGTWYGANCSWDNPRKVVCSNGHVLPNDEYPDDGTGYKAADGRTHYLVGVWNAWVTERWTQFALPALSQAYALTGDARYADRGALLLDALASVYRESTSGSWDYPSNPPSGRLCRPWYQVARTLVMYVDQYDLLYNSPAMDKPSMRASGNAGRTLTRRENIEQNLLLDGAYYCYAHSFSGALHNGHADYMRGALAVGCALDVPVYVRNAIESPFSIRTMLANNIDRDGRYYETSLGYAIHARNLYLTFADPLYNLRSEEYPEGINLYDDPRFRSCTLLPDLQATLAGRMPNFGDMAPDTSYRPKPDHPYSETDYDFLERLYARTSEPAKRAELGAALEWLCQGELGVRRSNARRRNWLLWHAAEPPEAEGALSPGLDARVNRSWVAGMKGLALLRAGDQAALLRFGPSLNHGDPDDLGLLYYANGYELSYDIGYGFGSAHCHVGWASQTVSHCLVTVDETTQFKGEIGTSGGSLYQFADLPGVKVVEASSERSYASLGVSRYRRTVALVADGGYLFDLFEVAGGRQHDYGWGSIGV